MVAGEAIGLLEGLAHQMLLQGPVVESGNTADGKPAIGIAGQQGLLPGRVSGGQQQLDQMACGPVVSGGIQLIEPLRDAVQDVGAGLLQRAQETAALTGRT